MYSDGTRVLDCENAGRKSGLSRQSAPMSLLSVSISESYVGPSPSYRRTIQVLAKRSCNPRLGWITA